VSSIGSELSELNEELDDIIIDANDLTFSIELHYNTGQQNVPIENDIRHELND